MSGLQRWEFITLRRGKGKFGMAQNDLGKWVRFEDAEKALARGNWIPVSERLPDQAVGEFRKHLVYCPTSIYPVAETQLHPTNWKLYGEETGLVFTHWQPLPPPPVDGKEVAP